MSLPPPHFVFQCAILPSAKLPTYLIISVMNTLIITDSIPEITTEEEQQLVFDEQLMLEREAYYQGSQY